MMITTDVKGHNYMGVIFHFGIGIVSWLFWQTLKHSSISQTYDKMQTLADCNQLAFY